MRTLRSNVHHDANDTSVHSWAGYPGVISRETLAFERLLAELSARFINLPAAEIDGAITDALRQIALLLDVDRAQLVRLAADSVELSHSWAIEGVFASVPPKLITQLFPWAIQRVRTGRAVVVPQVSDLPPEAHVDKATWQQNGVRSILVTPMTVAGRVEGAIAITCLRRARDWPDDLVVRMGVLAEVFANALAHKRAREALDGGDRVRAQRFVYPGCAPDGPAVGT